MSKKIIIFSLFCFFFLAIFSGISFAVGITWTELTIPGGTNYECRDIISDYSDPNVLYALIKDTTGGINEWAFFKSTDKGESWTEIEQARQLWNSYYYDEILDKEYGFGMINMRWIYQAPWDENKLYVCGQPVSSWYNPQYSVWVTTDEGISWTGLDPVVSSVSETLKMAFVKGDKNYAYRIYGAASWVTYKLQISTNEGLSWTDASSVPSTFVYCFAVNPYDHNNIVTANFSPGDSDAKEGLYYSTNEGQSFIQALAIPRGIATVNPTNMSSMFFNPYSTNEVFAYEHGGAAWPQVSKSVKPHFYKSTDLGASWVTWELSSIPTPFDPFWDKVEAVPSASDPNTFYLTSFKQFYRSDNKGQTWQEKTNGLGNLHYGPIAQTSEESSSVFVGAIFGGIYKSANNGDLFIKKDNGISTYSLYGVKVNPVSPNVIYAAPIAPFFRSFDYGKDGSWNSVSIAGSRGGKMLRSFTVDPDNPAVSFAVLSPMAEKGISKSTDYGSTWASKLKLGPTDGLVDIVISPSSPEVFYAAIGGENAKMVKSIDSGENWTTLESTVGSSEEVRDLIIDPSSADILYRIKMEGTDWGIKKSTDGGANWDKLYYESAKTNLITSVSAIAIDPQNNDILYAAVSRPEGERLFKTANAGTDWNLLSNSPQSRFIRNITVNPNRPNIVYVLAGLPGNYREFYLYRSTNSGTNWELEGSGSTIYGVGQRNFDKIKMDLDPVTDPVIYIAKIGSILQGIDTDVWLAPEIDSIYPTYGIRRIPIPVTISGNYFFGLQKVTIKIQGSTDTPLDLTVGSNDFTSISTLIPPSLDQGTYEVSVFCDNGTATITFEVLGMPTGGPTVSDVKFNDWSYYPSDFHFEPISPSTNIKAHVSDEAGISTVESFGITLINYDSPQDWGTREISGADDFVFTVGSTEGNIDVDVSPDILPGRYYMYVYAKDIFGNFGAWVGGAQVNYGETKVIGEVLSYPTVFKPLTEGSATIAYNLSRNADVSIFLYDVSGQVVLTKKFASGYMGGRAGYNQFEWSGVSDFGGYIGNGIYVIKITSGNKVIGTGKIVVFD